MVLGDNNMSLTLCGADCEKCNFKENCAGCDNTCGKPFGKDCFIYNKIKKNGKENFNTFKRILADEINELNIDNMPKVNELYCLLGSFVNLEYTLSNGEKIKFLDDNAIYLGTQLEDANKKKCYGVVASEEFILVCSYGENGANPKLVMYKKR